MPHVKPKRPASDVDDVAGELRSVVMRLGYWLRVPAVRSGITPSRLTMLAMLDRVGPMRPSAVADKLGITAASMSRLSDALGTAGLVTRTPDPDDQRAHRLGLTDAGLAALDEVRREGTADLAADIAALPAADREALTAALPVLAALADKHLS